MADFNGDGESDLAIRHPFDESVRILLANGDGTFQEPVDYRVGSGYSFAVVVGDFNGDGKTDLVSGNGVYNVLLGKGDGAFQTPTTFELDRSQIALTVGDVNDDGQSDLVGMSVESWNDYVVCILLGNGDGTFQEPANYVVDGAEGGVFVGDFNGDGKTDLLKSTINWTGTSSLTVLLNQSGATVTSQFSTAAASASKTEGTSGDAPFAFTVTRSGDTSGSATVDFAVSGSGEHPADTADFGGLFPRGTVSFATGESSKTITVNVRGDRIGEFDEGFTVTLSNPSTGAAIDTATSTGTILNDDAVLAIAATDAIKAEGDHGRTPFTFTVTRTGDVHGSASVKYTVAGQGTSAANSADFGGPRFPSGIVSFANGERSKTITVNVNGDTIIEPDEGFLVTLSNAVNAEIVASTASGTILNDDSRLSIAATDADRAEGDNGPTPFTFTVTRAGDLSRTASVKYTVTGRGTNASHTANAADFGGSFPSGTINFAVNQTTVVLTINVRGDSTSEKDEDFKVALSNPTNTRLNSAATNATGTIRNDDGAALMPQDNAQIPTDRTSRDLAHVFSLRPRKLWDGLDTV